jgi:hypothetical protein
MEDFLDMISEWALMEDQMGTPVLIDSDVLSIKAVPMNAVHPSLEEGN